LTCYDDYAILIGIEEKLTTGIFMINGKDLIEMGLAPGKIFQIAIKALKDSDKNLITKPFSEMLNDPFLFIEHPVLSTVAKALIENSKALESTIIHLNNEKCPTFIYGKEIIEQGAIKQIENASRLPISVHAALMPDAHAGYGLPIGGVLATRNSVIPYAVGLDIGCRMQLSVFNISELESKDKHDQLVDILMENTVFGVGKTTTEKIDHPILNNEFFNIPKLKNNNIHEKAICYLGTSGSGNHFVEFGFTTMPDSKEKFLSVLSHSGSRGVGSVIGEIYTKIAMENCQLEEEAKYLAWLSLDEQNGKDYWNAMTLAGAFAKANHDVIHSRIEKALGINRIARYENFHNFAWRETHDGNEVIVHRKGATPAGKGVVGLIPGSNTTNTYIVSGKGNKDTLCSSSHGAGRKMSRTVAKNTFTMEEFRYNLKSAGVTLLGGSVDECSMAYKDIDEVMQYQKDIVTAIGCFRPWIVRMADEQKKPWEKDDKE
jgi:tRNA-splicing ligase RtcB (3'-phosphate/5'-hydroxy nucleic acid ligase)